MNVPSYVGTYNLQIYQGATYTRTFVWNSGTCCGQGTVGSTPSPVDLTGYTVAMQIRPFPGAPVVYYDASPDITLGGVDGTIALSIPAPATVTFTWVTGSYDLILTDTSGNATPLLTGNVDITTAVTQIALWTADSAAATADSGSYKADG
jgi:hypothetical protein